MPPSFCLSLKGVTNTAIVPSIFCDTIINGDYKNSPSNSKTENIMCVDYECSNYYCLVQSQAM